MSRKYGSFDVEVDYYDEGKKYTKTHVVSPLSQQELGNGWRLVLPKKKMINVIKKNDENEDVSVRKTNESFFKINLSQLPPYLFSKLRNIYRGGQLSQYTARDNSYVYIVNLTPVDNEIRKLFRYCETYDNCMTSFSDSDKQEIRECLSAVNEHEIKGWVAMKANRLFSNI